MSVISENPLCVVCGVRFRLSWTCSSQFRSCSRLKNADHMTSKVKKWNVDFCINRIVLKVWNTHGWRSSCTYANSKPTNSESLLLYFRRTVEWMTTCNILVGGVTWSVSGCIAVQVHEKAEYICGVQLVTEQAGSPSGTDRHQKCCVFYKLLFVCYFVVYRIRTALKTTKNWSQYSCNRGYKKVQ